MLRTPCLPSALAWLLSHVRASAGLHGRGSMQPMLVFAISRRTRLPQPSAHARDDANLRTVNRAPLMAKIKRDVHLFPCSRSLARSCVPSLYCLGLWSFVYKLRGHLHVRRTFELRISISTVSSWIQTVGCCRYPRFWELWFPLLYGLILRTLRPMCQVSLSPNPRSSLSWHVY